MIDDPMDDCVSCGKIFVMDKDTNFCGGCNEPICEHCEGDSKHDEGKCEKRLIKN